MNKRALMLLTSLVAVFGLWSAPVSRVAAQSVTLEACYVPGSGTVYVINVPGAPDSCRSQQHVRFSWTTGIPAARCPAGRYMVGIDASGGLLCEPLPGDNSVGAFAGTYQLDSPLPVECTEEIGIAIPTFVSARISQEGEGGRVYFDLLDANDATFMLTQILRPEGLYDPSTQGFAIKQDAGSNGILFAYRVVGLFQDDHTVSLDVNLSFTRPDGIACTVTGTRTGRR